MTIEPALDYYMEVFVGWIRAINPEYVFLGYNSRPKQVEMPEPSEEKLKEFIIELKAMDIPIKGKDLRGIEV